MENSRFLTKILLPATGLLAFATLWQVSVLTGIVNERTIPLFTTTVQDLGQLLSLPGFWQTLGYTLKSTLLGLALAVVIALPLGTLIAVNPFARRLLSTTVDAIRPVPPIVILPIILLVVGGGIGFKSVLILQGALWALILQSAYGIKSIDPVVLDVAKSFRIGLLRTFFIIRLPAAAPTILSGVKLAASAAFGISVMSELVAGEKGLGAILALAQSGNNTVRVYSITIVTGLVGLVIALIFAQIEKAGASWASNGKRP